MKKTTSTAFLCALLLAGCATVKRSLLAGTATGATAGVFLGAESSPKNKKKKAAVGAAIGAALGGLAGYFIHGRLEKRDEGTRQETLLNLERFGTSWEGGRPECTPKEEAE